MSNNPYQQSPWSQPQRGYDPGTSQVPSQVPYFPPPPGSVGIPPPPPPPRPSAYPSRPVGQPVSAPPLPPRPMGGASRLAVHSNLNFPPPLPSPNRPPALPPRPQVQYQPTYSQPVHQQQYNQPSYSRPPVVQPSGPPPPYTPPVQAYKTPDPPVSPTPAPPALPVSTTAPPQTTSHTTQMNIPPVGPASPPVVGSRPLEAIPAQSGPVEDLGRQLQSVQLEPSSSSVPIYYAPPPPAVSSAREQQTPARPQAPTAAPQNIIPKQPPTQKNPFRHEPSGIQTVRMCVRDVKILLGLTTWYAHASAPQFTICSRCYADHVWPTTFRSAFPELPTEEAGKETRRCRFDGWRIKEQLFPAAVASGDLQPVFDFVSRRQGIPDCKAAAGADGRQGIRWFRPRDNAVPGMVVCEACWEDAILAKPAMAAHFEPAAGQGTHDTWTCDLALGSVARAYEEYSKTGWSGFVATARRRLGMVACRGRTARSADETGWHTPVNGPFDLILCDACYDDRVVGSGPEQERRWVRNDRRMICNSGQAGRFVCCASDYKCLIMLGATVDTKDWTRFWRAVERQSSLPACSGDGTKGTSWHTFASQPAEFGICGTCFACIIEPTELAAWFVPRQPAVGPDTALLCSMHERTRRATAYRDFLVQAWTTGDCAAWEQYAVNFAAVRPCSRDEDVQNAVWYGWPACTICHECYVDFVRGTALDSPETMPFRGVQREANTLCHMYSPRMRAVYREACARTPPDPTDLLAVAAERETVYCNTILVCRRMLMQQKLQAQQARFQGMMGSFYKNMGGMQAAVMPSAYRYSQVGVGSGFDNVWQLEGARLDSQAAGTASLVGSSSVLVVGQLEAQWRAVE